VSPLSAFHCIAGEYALPSLIKPGATPVPPSAVLVRGGEAKLSDLRRAVEKTLVKYDVAALSVYAGTDSDTALRDAALWNRQVRVAAAWAVYAKGWPVFYTFDWPHASVVLPDATDATLTEFVEVFDEMLPNPYVPAAPL
jgi:hypothetical protein